MTYLSSKVKLKLKLKLVLILSNQVITTYTYRVSILLIRSTVFFYNYFSYICFSFLLVLKGKYEYKRG